MYCVDNNGRMLHELSRLLRTHFVKNFRTIQNEATRILQIQEQLDVIFVSMPFTISISSTSSPRFREYSNRGDWQSYIREQSSKIPAIFGEGFSPVSCEKETRLLDIDEFENIVCKNPFLDLVQIHFSSIPGKQI